MRAVFVSLLLLAGCATTPGPVSSPAFPSLVAAAVPNAMIYGPSMWTPNSRQIAEFQNTSGAVAAMPWKDGVTAITHDGLSFMEWDAHENAYVVTRRFERDAITASLVTQGRSCALVVQEIDTATFHVFDFVRGVMNDCAKARDALAALG